LESTEPVSGFLGIGALCEQELPPDCEVREESKALSDIPDPSLLCCYMIDRLGAVPDMSGRRTVKPDKTAKQRRLAGA
jgi:hypothetical protein